MVSMDDIVNNPNSTQVVASQPVVVEPVNTIKTNFVSSSQQKPIILKPIAVIKGNNQLGDVRSHIKIGNNIFAVIHNNDNTNTLQAITSTVASTPIPKPNTQQSTKDVSSIEFKSRPAKRPHCSLDEHDYADEEDNDTFESTGVSKVNLSCNYLSDNCGIIISLTLYLYMGYLLYLKMSNIQKKR